MTTDATLEANQAGASPRKSFAHHLPTVARVLMGLIFFVFGLNGFLNFIPQPTTPMPEGAVAFLGALMKTGYMIRLIAATELIAGVLLLTNCFVPLALALLAPIVVNIIAFHIFLSSMGLVVAVFVLVMELYLAWSYRNAYRSMLAMHATPGSR